MIYSFAPAKLNLYLHVTGKKPNGFHALDSLVAFCDVGDWLRLEKASTFSFAMEGMVPEAFQNEDKETNLVVRAVRGMEKAVGKEFKGKFTLVKNLPVASGIGGGSADAAAALRLVAESWKISLKDPVLQYVAKGLGSDVPCCVASETCYFCDTGVDMDKGPDLPQVDLVLVNPMIALPTPQVFKNRTGAFSVESRLEKNPANPFELARMLQSRHNDLYEPACKVLPIVRGVMAEISGSNACLLARMSGSGATCFGLYPDKKSAYTAASQIQAKRPDWWVRSARLPQKSAKC